MSSLRSPAGGQQAPHLQQQAHQQQHLQFLQQQQLLQQQQRLLQQQPRLQQHPLQYCQVPQQQVLLPQYLQQQQHQAPLHQQQPSSRTLQHTRQLVTQTAYATGAAPVGLPPAHLPVVHDASTATAAATGGLTFLPAGAGGQLLQQPVAGRTSWRLHLVTTGSVLPQQADQLYQQDLIRHQQVLQQQQQHVFHQQQVLLQQQQHQALQHQQLPKQQLLQQQLLQQQASRVPYASATVEAPLQQTHTHQQLLHQHKQSHAAQPAPRIALRIGRSALVAPPAASGAAAAAAADAHTTSEEEDDRSSSGSSSSNSEEDEEGTRKKAGKRAAPAAARAGAREHHSRGPSRGHSSGGTASCSESRASSSAAAGAGAGAGEAGRSGSSKGEKKKTGEHPHAKARRTEGKKHRERRSSSAVALKQRRKAAKLYLKAVQYLTKATYILEDEGAVQHADSDSKSSRKLAKLLIRYDRVLGKLETYMSSNASLSAASVPVGLVHALDNNVDPTEWIRKCVLDVHRQKNQELRGVFAAFGEFEAALHHSMLYGPTGQFQIPK